jgi:hypothetical protein
MTGACRAKRIARWSADNEAAAVTILADPERYGGESGLMCRWARAILAGADALAQQWRLAA